MASRDRFSIVNHIRDLDSLNSYREIIMKNNEEIQIVEKLTISKSDFNRKEAKIAQIEYIQDLKALGFALVTGGKPAGISATVNQLFKDLFERLVQRGIFKVEALEVFK